MKRHHYKQDFQMIAITVISLEILAFLVFITAASMVVFNMFLDIPLFSNLGVIMLFVGGIVSAFVLFAIAEFLQLLMKIEVNTRKTEEILEASMKKTSVKDLVEKKAPAKKPTMKKTSTKKSTKKK